MKEIDAKGGDSDELWESWDPRALQALCVYPCDPLGIIINVR
jgi:hypothetical protein